ncbi:hypothetical protein GUITHDRAFT_155866 [Guillardia theta CCMP2712]|uniref:RWP-RK domain-containing protein n=1 Tax=Guillardia theta (strain CCMP2712) TaxID=905079 RepID=L1IDU1_GUITC|nr:hypothetical protein GUITHDRAFT_155866 [Guillardia theta CCMP2712]EKX33995.1 hypothetical protein GUITHDRAFT_155866 [Guillardia theta CCMP2712]|eukprot:XP_005820975.1 hypothetical protein GUITHDRAFT_155866 [Guillardia theta CCMP2712]
MAWTRPEDLERRIAAAIVCPRRKRTEVHEPLDEGEAEGPVVVTRALLESYFDMPLSTVSKELGICPTAIKRACRKVGILKWPFKTPNPGPKKKNGQPSATTQPVQKAPSCDQYSSATDLPAASFTASQQHLSEWTQVPPPVTMTFEDICNQVQFSCIEGSTASSWSKDVWQDDTCMSVQAPDPNIFLAFTNVEEENDFDMNHTMLTF